MALDIKEGVLLSEHSIFKIGGSARFFVAVKSEEELLEAIRWAGDQDVNVAVLGAGSNVLIADKGFHGLVIKIAMNGLTVSEKDKKAYADAGVSMARVVAESIKHNLQGFEWGIGIPGTVGGSIRGNAGCYGGEMKNVVEAVTVINRFSLEKSVYKNEECQFAYRDSVFKKKGDLIILSAVLALHYGNEAESNVLVHDYVAKRSQSQDIGSKSAGCIFKNIPWAEIPARESLVKEYPELRQFLNRSTLPAAYLIDQAGLKGRKIGAVQVSEKHANFIVNNGGGTAEQVMMLIALIKEYVHRKYGIMLEEEIQLIGF
ncbi:MAG: UDP-N-acetylmuramate dehydrogenase [Candidatus Sungbacteria bacterium]|nr:UDP-N-acetylmuramate dehydrogenase [Candidatus Sungbacteria bacterium]